MQCPSCHFEQPDANTTCEGCGLIFAKYNPDVILTGDMARKLREKQETPENGWTTHQIGGYTWRSGPSQITLHTSSGDEKVDPKSLEAKFLLVSIFIFVIGFLIGFYFLYVTRDQRIMFYMFEGFGLLFGLQSFVLTFFKLSRKRLMENIPFSTIRAMAPGQVEISGNAAGTAALQTPFTLKPCVYFECQIEQFVSTGKTADWMTLESGGSQTTPFTIDDGTGKAHIHPEGADTKFSGAYSLVTVRSNDIPKPMQTILVEMGLAGRMDSTLRFTERHFQEGQRVFVMAVCQQKTGLEESDEGMVFLGKGSRPGDLFIISDKSRENLEKQDGRSALTLILWGLGLIGVSVYFFVRGILK